MSEAALGATVGAAVPRVVVVGAGAANLKSTVALNLTAASAALGHAVALRDLDGASSRALSRAAGAGALVRLPWASVPIAVVTEGVTEADATSPHALLVVDAPPRLDARTLAALDGAALALVPADVSPIARRALREIAAAVRALARPPRVLVALTRLLPRSADRWAVIEELETLAPEGLLPITLPMARATRPTGADRLEARLYAPGTRSARAYASLARLVASELGLGTGDAGALDLATAPGRAASPQQERMNQTVAPN